MKITKLAAIDVGSNAVRMLINSVYDNGNKLTFNKTSLVRVPIRLGRDSFVENKISEKNVERLIDAMKAYKLLMNVHDIQAYSAFATSAMREVSNGESIINKIYKKTGINLQLIDGKREAEIIFATELKEYVKDDNSYLYVDVGGGSTECTLLTNGEVKTSKSFPIGTVRWLEGKVDGEKYLKKMVKPWVRENCEGLEVELIGSGGNINHIFKRSGRRVGKALSYSFINREKKAISSMSFEERLSNYNMKTDRADVIIPALNIYTSIMRFAKSKKIHVPKIGLSDGMIQYMYQNNKY